jgi:AcrR family transcriptional regulator
MNAQLPTVDSRIKILIEAERLFRHYGYSKTTMSDIADGCGMSPANLYRFFPSKLALIEAICGRIASEIERRLYAIVRAEEEPASERLRRFIAELHQHTLENLLDHRKVHEMVVVAMQEQWHAVRAHIDRVTLYIGEIIKDGIATGEFRQQDVNRAAKCVHSAIASLCHPIIVAQKLDDDDRPTPDEMAALIISALRTNP